MDAKNRSVRKIKKYANRKLYDTVRKRYISLDRLGELIKQGEEVVVEDNETGEDITTSVVSQLLAREKKDSGDPESSSILIQLLRKGRGTVAGYARKTTGLWQSAVTLAEDEIDRLVNMLVKNKEITESEGGRLKKELMGRADNFKKWVGDKVDQRVSEALGMMNLATREQVVTLTRQIEALTQAVERMERERRPKKGAVIKSYPAEEAAPSSDSAAG